MSSLSELEGDHQEILDDLHDISIGNNIDKSNRKVISDLDRVVSDWDRLFGGDIASNAVGEKVDDLQQGGFTRDTLRQLDLLIDPLRHYVIALENYKQGRNRETVTRAGMVVERIVVELCQEMGDPGISEQKMNNSLGQLQSELAGKDIDRARQLIDDMRGVWHLRNDRGPHDVPVAERIQAKWAISSLIYIYYRYLRIVSDIGESGLSNDDIVRFTNLLDELIRFSPTLVLGEEGTQPTTEDILKDDLYRHGFFEKERSLSEVMDKMGDKGYNFSKSTVSGKLDDISGDAIAKRGDRGSYGYIERIPPEEYFA